MERKDGQRHANPGKKMFEVEKDTQRRIKTRKDGKMMFKLSKTPKDRQRHAKTAKIFIVDKDTQNSVK